MDAWWAPPHQSLLKNNSTNRFGYDQTGRINYHFNEHGFRGKDFSDQDSVFVIGNSVSFGVGLLAEETFLEKLSQKMHRAAGNLSYGCYAHENHDHLPNLVNLSRRDRDDIILIQINNLDRRRHLDQIVQNNPSSWCVARLIDYMDQVDELLQYKTVVWTYWDDRDHQLPPSLLKKITIYNKGHVDSSLLDHTFTFGAKSHNLIFHELDKAIDQKRLHIL